MPEPTDVNALLGRFVVQLRRALDPRIEVQMAFAGEARACEVDAPQLESALTELVRRVCDAMPPEGVLRLRVERCSDLPTTALIPVTGPAAPHGWLALSVGSRQADTPDLRWDAKFPRAHLPRFVREVLGALSVRPLDGRGADIVLYLRCAPAPAAA